MKLPHKEGFDPFYKSVNCYSSDYKRAVSIIIGYKSNLGRHSEQSFGVPPLEVPLSGAPSIQKPSIRCIKVWHPQVRAVLTAHLPQNLMVGKFIPGAMCSLQTRAGSHWAHVADVTRKLLTISHHVLFHTPMLTLLHHRLSRSCLGPGGDLSENNSPSSASGASGIN